MAQFLPAERPAASRLVDALDFVSATRFRIELAGLVDRVLDTVQRPAALYPVWEQMPPPTNELQAAGLAEGAGSESIVRNVLRDVARAHHPGVVLEPSLQLLRSDRFRSVVFVDDFSGSGNKTASAVERWLSHPTIRSWQSFGWLQPVVVVHTVSRQAAALLKKRLPRVTVEYQWAAREFEDAHWTVDELNEVRDLCRRYAKSKKYWFGYGESGLLTVFQHTAPNNLPMVLWQRPNRSFKWSPFFSHGQVSAVQAEELADYVPSREPGAVASSLGERRIAAAMENLPTQPSGKLVLLLAAIAHGHRDYHRLARDLRVPRVSVVRLVAAATELSLLDQGQRLTERGRAELRAARSRSAFARPVHVDRDDPYYPRYR